MRQTSPCPCTTAPRRVRWGLAAARSPGLPRWRPHGSLPGPTAGQACATQNTHNTTLGGDGGGDGGGGGGGGTACCCCVCGGFFLGGGGKEANATKGRPKPCGLVAQPAPISSVAHTEHTWSSRWALTAVPALGGDPAALGPRRGRTAAGGRWHGAREPRPGHRASAG
jgi:hypothetical protein